MPYSGLACNDCDTLVLTPGPHGPEDEYCEGESGYERIDLYAMDSPGDEKAWHKKKAAELERQMIENGKSRTSKVW